MKNFVKENWYKLMVGSSLMMASFGFMINSVSPVYSNSENSKIKIRESLAPNSPITVNGSVIGDYAFFVDAGVVYMYHWREKYMKEGETNHWRVKDHWAKWEIQTGNY